MKHEEARRTVRSFSWMQSHFTSYRPAGTNLSSILYHLQIGRDAPRLGFRLVEETL